MFVNKDILTIVSRKSRLALKQADLVKQQLNIFYPQLKIEIIGISTSGDEILDQPLMKIGGKGLFVNELEKYLLQNKADMAVHSMKDLPASLADGLIVTAILPRADSRDVLVSIDFASINQLPPGSIVGTSSLRRQAQLLAIRPDISITSLRGNVDTRLEYLISGKYSAIILAAAGLERLGLTTWIKHTFTWQEMLPAVGQGALGIEIKADNTQLQELLRPLHDWQTAACVQAERAMNAILDGGCQAPIAGFASIKNQLITLRGLVAEPDGKIMLRAVQSSALENIMELGRRVADDLLAQGAAKIISKLKTEWQGNGW
jgi:hydroxymethylbilane synthase